MKIISLISLAIAAIALPVSSFAGEWRHIKLTSTNGTEINIDYIYNVDTYGGSDYKKQFTDTANPVFINVSGPSVRAEDRVRVVLNVQEAYSSSTRTLDLEWKGTHFSGSLENAEVSGQAYFPFLPGTLVIRSSGYGGTIPCSQKLSIVVSGNWLVNRDSGNTDFHFDMSKGSL